MKTIVHQLSTESFYIPQWEIKHLFLGTFNPSGGETVKYYYGRPRNQTWNLLSKIFNDSLNPNSKEFFEKLKAHKIGCVDLIHSVTCPDEDISDIIGRGYSDNKIINGSVKRIYNTEIILDLIRSNPNCLIYSTWGKGSTIKDWKKETEKIKNITPLVSPSLVARVPAGVEKYEFMLSNWQRLIQP